MSKIPLLATKLGFIIQPLIAKVRVNKNLNHNILGNIFFIFVFTKLLNNEAE